MPMKYKVSAVIEQDDDGFYAYCPELPGCQTQGDTFEEAVANIREAAALYMSTLPRSSRRELLSREIVTTSFEVQVA